MFRNLIQFYSISICFVASIVMMITIPSSINTFADLAFTPYRNANYMDNFSTNEKYIAFVKRNDNTISTTDPEKIKEIRLAEGSSFIAKEKAEALSKIFDRFIWMMTGMVFFIIHWKLYKKEAVSNILI